MKTSMNAWNSRLIVNGGERGTVNIKLGILQGDSLSLLLLIIALIPVTIILNSTGLEYQL